MRPSLPFIRSKTLPKHVRPPLVRIDGATFYLKKPEKTKPDAGTPGYFPNLKFELPSVPKRKQTWALICQDSNIRKLFIDILRGQHYAYPESARSYPYLRADGITLKNPKSRVPAFALQYVGFESGTYGSDSSSISSSYLGERFESRGRKTGLSLIDYLTGITELDKLEGITSKAEKDKLNAVVQWLKLDELRELPLKNLSTGQLRRARIAKALLQDSEAVLLDSPFVGLDPWNRKLLSSLLYEIAASQAHRIFLALKRPQDVPAWISHLIYTQSDSKIVGIGPKPRVLESLRDTWGVNSEEYLNTIPSLEAFRRAPPNLAKKKIEPPKVEKRTVLEMNGLQIRYSSQIIVGDWKQNVDGSEKDGLWWKVTTGERWGLFGPNGSGKSTIISVISSDHPQSYAVPLRIFGKDRLPSKGSPGISYFEIQSRIGLSSPELHTSFPKHLSVRRTIESAWADSPLSKPLLVYDDDLKVDACLRWFQADLLSQSPVRNSTYQNSWKMLRETKQQKTVGEAAEEELSPNVSAELDWADETTLADLPLSSQKVALFLRAIIRTPDLLLLDEAFSGMNADLRDKCLVFLEHGEKKVLRMVKVGRKLSLRLYSSRVVVKEQIQMRGMLPHQTLIAVSHEPEDVPLGVRDWICLPEPGQGSPRFGRFQKSIRRNPTLLDKIVCGGESVDGGASSDDVSEVEEDGGVDSADGAEL